MKNKLITILSVSLISLAVLTATIFAVVSSSQTVKKIDGMVAVEGVGGKTGYAKEEDMNRAYTPEGVMIPVYDKDCKTVIDEFKLGGYEESAPVVAIVYDQEKGITLLYKDSWITLEEFHKRAKQDGLSQEYIDSVDADASEQLQLAQNTK